MTVEKDRNLWDRVRPWVSGYLPALSLACLVLIVVMSFLSPHFLSLTSLKNILLGTAVIGIISFGMTMVLISGDIDLSVGSVVALSSVVLCVSLNADLSLPVALLLTAAAAVAVGLVNGFFVSVLEINSFIITLGTMSVIRGLGYVILGGTSLKGGKGRLAGTVLGTLFVAVLLYGQDMLDELDYEHKLMSKGIIILIAMGLPPFYQLVSRSVMGLIGTARARKKA